jgi:hypothetical protein
MKKHKVDKDKIKTTDVVTVPALSKVYYVGNHPHLIDSMGVAEFDEKVQHWLYKPETIHSEWYRVNFTSLVFEKA